LRNTTRTRLAVGDHGFPVRVHVVVGIGAAGGGVIGPGVFRSIGTTPAATSDHAIAAAAAVKTNPLAVRAPEFVLVPFIRRLSGDRHATSLGDIQNPHSIWQWTVFVTEQDEISIFRVDVHMI